MWLFTPFGFYSVVEDRARPGQVLVRGRVLADMLALQRDYLPGMEIIGGAGTDYAWRGSVERGAWEAAVAAIAADIDYGNFKDAVHHRQGRARARAYLAIWDAMVHLQMDDPDLPAAFTQS